MKRYIVLLNTRFYDDISCERPLYYCVPARTPQAAANKVCKMARKELYRTYFTVLAVDELNEDNERALRAASADKSKRIEELKRLIETAQRELAAEEKILRSLDRITDVIAMYDK